MDFWRFVRLNVTCLLPYLCVACVFPTRPLTEANVGDMSVTDSSGTIRAVEALHERAGQPLAVEGQRIYIHSRATHHIHSEQGIVAWRSSDGHWHKSRASFEGGGLSRAEPETDAEVTLLSDTLGRRLDRLIAHQSLMDGPLETNPVHGHAVGAATHVMVLDVRTGQRVVPWSGRLRGHHGQIADILLGRGRD